MLKHLMPCEDRFFALFNAHARHLVDGAARLLALVNALGHAPDDKTMGQKITKLKPVGGFCAEVGGAATLFLASGLGIPVLTTHTITGAIMGVGALTILMHQSSKSRAVTAGKLKISQSWPRWRWRSSVPATGIARRDF
ncbi:MAG: inorganic phosphate transporter [Solimonas sp.]